MIAMLISVWLLTAVSGVILVVAWIAEAIDAVRDEPKKY